MEEMVESIEEVKITKSARAQSRKPPSRRPNIYKPQKEKPWKRLGKNKEPSTNTDKNTSSKPSKSSTHVDDDSGSDGSDGSDIDIEPLLQARQQVSVSSDAIINAFVDRQRDAHQLAISEMQRKFSIEREKLQHEIVLLEEQRAKSIDVYQLNIKTLTDAKEALKGQLKNMSKSIQQKDSELADVESKYQDIKRILDGEEKGGKYAKGQMYVARIRKEIEEEYQKRLHALNSAHIDEVESLNKECSVTVQQARADLLAMESQAKSLENDIISLREENKAIMAEYSAMEQKYLDLKKEMQSQQASSAYNSTTSRVTELEFINSALKHKNEEKDLVIADLKKNYSEALEEIIKFEKDKPSAPSTTESTQSARRSSASFNSSSRFLERKLQVENSKLKARINRLESNINEQKSELDKARSEKEILKTTGDQRQEGLKRRIKTLENQLGRRSSFLGPSTSATPEAAQNNHDLPEAFDVSSTTPKRVAPSRNTRVDNSSSNQAHAAQQENNSNNESFGQKNVTDLFSTSPLVRTPEAVRRHYAATAARRVSALPLRISSKPSTATRGPAALQSTATRGAVTKPVPQRSRKTVAGARDGLAPGVSNTRRALPMLDKGSPSILDTPKANPRLQDRRLGNNNKKDAFTISEFSATPFISRINSQSNSNAGSNNLSPSDNYRQFNNRNTTNVEPRSFSADGGMRKEQFEATDVPQRKDYHLNEPHPPRSFSDSRAESFGSDSPFLVDKLPLKKRAKRQLSSRSVMEPNDFGTPALNRAANSRWVSALNRDEPTENAATDLDAGAADPSRVFDNAAPKGNPAARPTFAQSFTANFSRF